VTRWFPPEIRHDRLAAEVYAYLRVPWAAPRLLWATDDTICVERCTPILDVPKDPGHALQLRALLERIHDAGVNHCDVAVSNVVRHPARGVLLIDWEVSIRAGQALSYDLHGAAAAGLSWRPPEHQRPDGVWWGGPSDLAPARYWGEA
jgi:hypothetical protein